jgi:hypothetical protein
MNIIIPLWNGWKTRFSLWMGRDSENNKNLSFAGCDGLNQRSRGYWHRTYWCGPVFFSIARSIPGQALWS